MLKIGPSTFLEDEEDEDEDLPKYHKYEQISMTQRSLVHSLGFMWYKISLAIQFVGK